MSDVWFPAKPKVTVRRYGVGTQARDWTYTSAVSQAITVGFFTHCATAGTPKCDNLIYIYIYIYIYSEMITTKSVNTSVILHNHHYFVCVVITLKIYSFRSSLVAQQVKGLALSLQQLRSLLWCGFDPWPGNLRMLRMWPPPKKNLLFWQLSRI